MEWQEVENYWRLEQDGFTLLAGSFARGWCWEARQLGWGVASGEADSLDDAKRDAKRFLRQELSKARRDLPA